MVKRFFSQIAHPKLMGFPNWWHQAPFFSWQGLQKRPYFGSDIPAKRKERIVFQPSIFRGGYQTLTFLPSISPPTETWIIIKLSLTWGQLWRRSPTWPWERAIWSEKSYCGRMAYGLAPLSARAHGVTMYTFDRKVYKMFWKFGLRRKLVNQKKHLVFLPQMITRIHQIKWPPGLVPSLFLDGFFLGPIRTYTCMQFLYIPPNPWSKWMKCLGVESLMTHP